MSTSSDSYHIDNYNQIEELQNQNKELKKENSSLQNSLRFAQNQLQSYLDANDNVSLTEIDGSEVRSYHDAQMEISRLRAELNEALRKIS